MGRVVHRQRRLSEAVQVELVAAFQTGTSVYELARRFQISRQTAYAVLERHHVPRRYNVLTPDDIEHASELYAQGWSLARIASHYAVSTKTIHTALREAGIKLRPVGTNQWT